MKHTTSKKRNETTVNETKRIGFPDSPATNKGTRRIYSKGPRFPQATQFFDIQY